MSETIKLVYEQDIIRIDGSQPNLLSIEGGLSRNRLRVLQNGITADNKFMYRIDGPDEASLSEMRQVLEACGSPEMVEGDYILWASGSKTRSNAKILPKLNLTIPIKANADHLEGEAYFHALIRLPGNEIVDDLWMRGRYSRIRADTYILRNSLIIAMIVGDIKKNRVSYFDYWPVAEEYSEEQRAIRDYLETEKGPLSKEFLSESFKKARQDAGLSIRGAADYLGVSKSMIAKVENGQATASRVAELLDGLGYDVGVTVTPRLDH